MKLSGELNYRIRYDVEHDLFHAQNVFNDEYITPTFIEYVQKLEKENAVLEQQIEKMKAELHRRLVSPSHSDSDCLDKIVGLDRLWQFGQEF